MDARGIPRGANPLPRIRSWTPVDVGGAPLEPIRNQQVGGSSPPVGSNDFKGLRASRPTPEVAGKHMGSSRSRFGGHNALTNAHRGHSNRLLQDLLPEVLEHPTAILELPTTSAERIAAGRI